MDNWHVQQVALSTHVKTVKFVGDFLFIGRGNIVYCYDWKQKKHAGTEIVFSGIHSVHGIEYFSVEEKVIEIIIYGDKVFRVYEFVSSASFQFRPITDPMNIGDWIHDICFLESVSDYRSTDLIAIITAHNCVIFWNWKKQEKFFEYHCASKCILYSAKILSRFKEVFVVACGTVFKEILVWSPNSASSPDERNLPFHQLSGHQGVIFSIAFNANRKLLCSSSDDRSLRIWKFTCNQSCDILDTTLSYWTRGEFTLVHILYGHESRVWASVILEKNLISVGEDSSVCFWGHDRSLVRKEKCHKGGSVWCVDVNLDGTLAATGGSDSAVIFWGVQECFQDGFVKLLAIEQKDDFVDFPRNLLFINLKNHLILFVITDKGKFLMYDANDYSLMYEHSDDAFKSYCVPALSDSNDFLLIGSLQGIICLYAIRFESKFEFLPLKEEKVCDTKINNIHWVSNEADKFLVCGLHGNMILWKMQKIADNNFCFIAMYDFCLPKAKVHWWSTVCIFLKSKDILAVGDRSGSVHFYYNISCSKQNNEKRMPDKTYLNIHGKNGISDLKFQNGFLLSSGTDGKLISYRVSQGTVHKLHHVKVTKELEWLGRIVLREESFILLGFHATKFIAWNQKQERSVMTVNCGGGHRSWDFTFFNDNSCFFAAIRKKQIMISKSCTSLFCESPIVHNGISGMSFCCVCFLFNMNHEKHGDISILACGGEDPSLKLIGYSCHDVSEPFMLLHNISGHLSSVRAISKCEMPNDDSFLVVSVGGRAQMMIWKIYRSKDQLVSEEIACDFLWNVDKSVKKPWKNSFEPVEDPLTRYMDVAVWQLDGNDASYCIASASSDSFLRLHSFDIARRKLQLLATIKHGDHCILKISNLVHPLHGEWNTSSYIATAANDGCIRIYDVYSAIKLDQRKEEEKSSITTGCATAEQPLNCLKIHQSGVNALDARNLSSDLWLIVSGGDDNALSAVLISINQKVIETMSKCIEKNAHASQITGIRILTDNTIVSVSIDQRVNIWILRRLNSHMEFSLMHSEVCCIPDVINMEVWMQENSRKEWKAVVCGEGLQSFFLKHV